MSNMAVDLSSLSPERQKAILDGPALAAPLGIRPNFAHPPNRNAIPEAVIPICLTLVTLSVLLRSYARVFITKRVAVDDILSLLGCGTFIYYIYSVHYVAHNVGLFVHQWNVTLRTAEDVQQILQLAATCYTITLALVKSAILLQWIRIFAPSGTRGAFFWTCQSLLWINVLFYIATTTAGNLICVPFQRIWDKTVPGVCFNGRTLNMTIGVFNLASDLCILLLPQRIIWRLNMTLRRKLGIALTFAVGLLACAAAALRLGMTVSYMTDPDWLYHVASLSMSCIAEMTCILLVYNMPGIPLAFRESHFLSRAFSRLSSSLRSATGQNNLSGFRESDAAAKSISSKGKYDEMTANAISLNNYPGRKFKHSPSTEHLRDENNRTMLTTSTA